MPIDQTPIGPQYVIPGAERVGDADLAKRRAAEPLRGKDWQKPCDVGLFSDTAQQTDLINLINQARKP